MIIAVDGPAGAGKGTISSYLAIKFDLLHLDTGMLFRALAKAVISRKVALEDTKTIADIARTITVKHTQDPDLRGEEVAAVASKVAVIPEARQALTELQQEFCQSVPPPYQGVILDGRDIGTVICPDADCKLFVTARPEIRNQRRLLETPVASSTPPQGLSQIARKMAERDARDSSRQIAPLTPASDAFIIDTSDLTIEQACAKAAQYVIERCFGKAGSMPGDRNDA